MKFPSQKIVVSLICVFCAAIFMIFANPFKVTDPADPRFNPDRFKFSDYGTREELANAFRVMFSPGTPKEFVDQVLIDGAHARIGMEREIVEEAPKYIFISYIEPINFFRTIKKPFFHGFIYDESYKVVNILPFGGKKVFSDQPDNVELNQMKPSNQRKVTDD